MRIAFYCNWYVKQTIPVANALVEEHEVLLIVPRVSDDESASDGCIGAERLRELLDSRVSLVTLDGMQGLNLGAPAAVQAALRTLRAFQPDVVHLHESYDFRSLLLTMLMQTAFVLTVHDPVAHPGERISLRRFKHWVRDRTRRRVGGLLVLGESLRELLAREAAVSISHVFAVPHTLSVPKGNGEVAPRSDGFRRILFFGRWEAYKGLDVLIRAEPLINARHPSARIVLAGTGRVSLSEIRPLMQAPERFEVLNFAIPDNDVRNLFSRAEMLALPYREASQSGPLHIAALTGCPVVASGVGAIAESVRDGVTGLLVPPGDVEALAAAVNRLLDDPPFAQALAAAAKARIEAEHAPATIAARHVAAYGHVIAEHRREVSHA